MVTEAAEGDGEETGERPLLLAAEIGGWPGLGGDVRIEVGERRTVLVGKNGAGKSLLVDGLYRASVVAVGGLVLGSAPLSFRCDLQIPSAPPIAYEYDAGAIDAGDETAGTLRRNWRERCWKVANDEDIWRIGESKLVVGSGRPSPFAPGVGLLGVKDPSIPSPGEVESIARLLKGVRIVSAGIPRTDGERRAITLTSAITKGSRVWLSDSVASESRVVRLAHDVTKMWDRDRERYDELRQILLDLGVIRDVAIKVYTDPTPEGAAGPRQDLAAVLFDGVNLGLQSDGTLRVAEIVLKLLQPDVRCLLVEEPETAVHPGLLAKLLALFDTYSLDRQIVVSTHSPEVVNWCRPEDLRLVVREEGVTRAHALEPADMESVVRYLQNDGSLADFVYRRQRT
jgi:hypothetical protein